MKHLPSIESMLMRGLRLGDGHRQDAFTHLCKAREALLKAQDSVMADRLEAEALEMVRRWPLTLMGSLEAAASAGSRELLMALPWTKRTLPRPEMDLLLTTITDTDAGLLLDRTWLLGCGLGWLAPRLARRPTLGVDVLAGLARRDVLMDPENPHAIITPDCFAHVNPGSYDMLMLVQLIEQTVSTHPDLAWADLQIAWREADDKMATALLLAGAEMPEGFDPSELPKGHFGLSRHDRLALFSRHGSLLKYLANTQAD